MSYRPMMRGLLGAGAATGGFSMTAGATINYTGYVSAQAASDFNETAIGSVSGDKTADGGTVEVILDAGSLYILNGNEGATNLNIDGTDYTLTFQGPTGPYDYYTFNGPDFVSGNTYQITVT